MVCSPSRRAVVALGLAAPWCGRAVGANTPTGAPALLLARVAPAEMEPRGYLISEKLDGVRAHWDGATLRFRGGGVIPAPAGFLAGLPAGQALDGELWLGRGRFDALSAIVRREVPRDAEWAGVRYLVFEMPEGAGTFAQRVERLHAMASDHAGRRWEVVPQERLHSADALRARLATVVAVGGEGLMLHRADAPYVTGRQPVLFKLKPVRDAEAVVVGHTPGQGRLAGQIGALRVRGDDGREFLIGTGLSDALRGSPPPEGSVVTYSWRGETATGLPRFPALVRLHQAGW